MAPDPKTRRVVVSDADWKLLRARLIPRGTKCACGCGRLAESLHHLVGRGQGGDDVEENLVALAGDGTRLCHGALTSAQRAFDARRKTYITPHQVRSGIRRHLTVQKRNYIIRKKGPWFLDAYYPREVR